MEHEKINEVLASGLGVKPHVGRVCIGTATQKSLLEEHMEDKMNGKEITHVVIDEATQMSDNVANEVAKQMVRKLVPVCKDCEYAIDGCTTICKEYPQKKPRDVARFNYYILKSSSPKPEPVSNQLYYCDPELHTTCKKTNCKILGTGMAVCDGTRHIEFAKKPIEKIRIVLPYDKDLVEAANETENQPR